MPGICFVTCVINGLYKVSYIPTSFINSVSMIIKLNITTLWVSQVIQMIVPCEVLYKESDHSESHMAGYDGITTIGEQMNTYRS